MHHTCPDISSLDNITHCFFGINGGVSDGIYTSLNCGYGSGDDLEKVTKNREIVVKTMGGGELVTVHQTHSADCVTVENAWDYKNAPQADALVTGKSGIILGILTADCLPILFADSNARVIGAAHSGWKGAIGGIIEATISKMQKLGAKPEHIIAAIGPAISKESYEIGEEFFQCFIAHQAENREFFMPSVNSGHYMFDLPAYAKKRLLAAGIGNINMIAQDTYLNNNEFFSYRRSCKRNEPAYGRQISTIMLT